MKVFYAVLLSLLLNKMCSGSDLAFLGCKPILSTHSITWLKTDYKSIAFRARPAKKSFSYLMLQSKQDSRTMKDFFIDVTELLSGLVSGTGSSIHFGDANGHEEISSISVSKNMDTISAETPGVDSIDRAVPIDVDMERLLDILRRDSIDDPAEWVELLEGISCGLVSRFAEQPIDIGDGDKFTLPTVHLSAMRLIGRLQEQIKATDAKLYSSFKWVAKKNSLTSFIATALSRSLQPTDQLQQRNLSETADSVARKTARRRRPVT
jgi:hypothetical protein